MSSYVRDINWDDYQTEDDENYYEIYDYMEQEDKKVSRKRQTKMRAYEGYEFGNNVD